MEYRDYLHRLEWENTQRRAKKDAIESELAEIDEQMKKLWARKHELVANQSVVLREIRAANNSIREEQQRRQREEAEKLAAKANEPDFENPELKLMMEIMKHHPKFDMVRNFQLEDIVFIMDRMIRKDFFRAGGVINGNEMGTGKTAETAIFLTVLEKYREYKGLDVKEDLLALEDEDDLGLEMA